jgi:cell division protein FtsN
VGAGRFGGREIGVAVLGSTDLWGDLKHLLEYGFGTGVVPESAAPEVEMASAQAAAAAGDDGDESVSAPRRASRYFVGVRSFRARQSAHRLKAALVKQGYPCSVQKVRRGRRPLYQVLVGSYPSRRRAEQVAGKLKRQHQFRPRLIVAGR